VVISLVVIGVGTLWLTGQSLKPIEEAYFRLKRFTDDASHELRSPLMAIRSNIELVLKRSNNLEPEFQNSLKVVQSAVDQMTNLTEELLVLATSDQERPSAPQSAVDLKELLEAVVAETRLEADEKKIQLEREFQDGLYVSGSKQELRGVFGNILRNAIAYTPENGNVKITSAANDGNVLISVKDTGIGIAEADIPKIFDRFWRADRSREHSSGAGLGLSIAGRLAKRHGGSIKVESALGKGSTFTVSLPTVSNS